jgi:hypothetical protein
MTRAFAYVAFILSALFAVWYVAGWADAINDLGLAGAVYMHTHWPAALGTVFIPVFALGFLCLGMSLLPRD